MGKKTVSVLAHKYCCHTGLTRDIYSPYTTCIDMLSLLRLWLKGQTAGSEAESGEWGDCHSARPRAELGKVIYNDVAE